MRELDESQLRAYQDRLPGHEDGEQRSESAIPQRHCARRVQGELLHQSGDYRQYVADLLAVLAVV